MKILITVGIYPPDIGGPASFVPKIAKKFKEEGFEVTVLCLSEEKISDHEEYKVVRILRRQNLILRWIKTIFLIIKNGRKSDVIFVNGLPMESYLANIILRKKLIRKVVGDWAWERGRNRGITKDSFDDFQTNKHSLHLEFAKFSRGWTATKADLVITPSKHLESVVRNWGVSNYKTRVIYNGTKVINNISKPNNDPYQFITVGRLAPWKNIDVIINSFKELEKSGMNFIFYIVGSGPLQKKLENLVKELELENKIIFTGQKNKAQLEEIYINSDIYIQASGYEGLPHVILEAINYELSIISTPIGGTNEILLDGKNAWIIDLIDNKAPGIENLKEMIKNVVEKIEENEIKKNNAKNYIIEKFNEDNNIKKYIEIMKL